MKNALKLIRYSRILIASSLIFIALSTSAQSRISTQTPQYSLRDLSASEFIDGLPDFLTLHYATEGTTPQLARNLLEATEAEFLARYGATAALSDYLAAFRRFRAEVIPMPGDYDSVIDMNAWVARLIEHHLAAYAVDLDAIESLDFHPFNATIERRDLDNDDQPEWLFDMRLIEELDDVYYRNFLVVTAAPDEGDYRVLPIPIPYTEAHIAWEENGWTHQNLGFQDINADGQPEWLFRTEDDVPGPNFTMVRRIYAITLHDGKMIPLFIGDADVSNVDDDPAHEFVSESFVSDNWGCGQTTTTIYDWDGQGYNLASQTVTRSNCDGRDAELAMWAGDFAQAASLYDTYLSAQHPRWEAYLDCRSQGDFICDDPLWLDNYLHFLARRIVAYALLGDETTVERLIQEVLAHEVTTNFIRALGNANSYEAETICQAAYQYFSNDYMTERNNYGLSYFLPGELRTNVYDGFDPQQGFRVNPSRAGCDPALFGTTPTPTPTPTWTPYPTRTPDTRPQRERLIEFQSVYYLFSSGDYEAAMIIAETTQPYDADDAARWQYWRALIYQTTNRPDEALEEYVSLYLNHPGSWWAWLAGLHLEPTIETT